jgi:hypothetical protein
MSAASGFRCKGALLADVSSPRLHVLNANGVNINFEHA